MAQSGKSVSAEAAGWQRLALWTVLFQLAWYWRKIPDLLFHGAMPDTDDYVRLQQVRDWIGGQGWFDLVQRRMDPPVGADIHWSRLVDLPIAALVKTFSLFLDQQLAERMAALAWPTILLVLTVLVIVRICRSIAADFNPLVALLFTVTCMTALSEYMPGRIDHHSLQILFFTLTLLGLVNPDRNWSGWLIGAAIAASISVGLDSVLLFAMMLAWIGLEWALAIDRQGNRMRRVAGGMAGAALVLYGLNFPPQRWFEARCDANSLVYLAALIGIAAGFGLLSSLSQRLLFRTQMQTVVARLTAGSIAGGILLLALWHAFPQCASGPYGAISDELKTRWLVNVAEAMGFLALANKHPELWLSGIGFSLLLLVTGALVVWKTRAGAPQVIAIYAMVVLSVAVTFIQYRALRIGIFASIPLSVVFVRLSWEWLRENLGSGRHAPALAQIFVILAMMSPSWFVVGTLVFAKDAAQQPVPPAIGDAVAAGSGNATGGAAQWRKSEIHPMCNRDEQYSRLAALPNGLVMSDVNSGPVIIVKTGHSVVGGPYHRNERAILDMVDFFETDLEKPRAIALRRPIDYVAWCDPGKPVTPELENNPALAIHLLKGSEPDWLERVSSPDERLLLFRVRRDRLH
ncbi:MAG: hypothetical protein KDJ66_04155 [Nitratireductor sp.]|nr:hypothetical protein [Nitratireductor sp.]